MRHPVIVREATPAERPAIFEVTRLSYLEYAEQSGPSFWAGYEANMRAAILGEDGSRCLLAELDGVLAASVLLCPPRDSGVGTVPNPYPEMRLLAVLPEQRNLRLGARLIEKCELLARDEGFEAITLHTTVLMLTAKAMYERRGYEPWPELDFEPVPGFTVWGYRKRLR